MGKDAVIKTIIDAIIVIESKPEKYSEDYVICDALSKARDYLMGQS